jgi:hypothetical protein
VHGELSTAPSLAPLFDELRAAPRAGVVLQEVLGFIASCLHHL